MKKEDTKPWWQYGYVWLIISGPLTVIVAGVVTVYYAVSYADPVIENYYVKGININQTLTESEALAPALKARNHAATGLRRD